MRENMSKEKRLNILYAHAGFLVINKEDFSLKVNLFEYELKNQVIKPLKVFINLPKPV